MKDRFKFRVWCTGWGCFIYPTQINFEHGVAEYITTGGEYNEVDIKGLHIEQCAGLKDKNGKLIFEGDILKDKDGLICFVAWFDGGFWVETPGNGAKDFECSEFYNSSEIIGNIYENAELLEDKER